MEIKNDPVENHEILDFPNGKVEVVSGGDDSVYLKIQCNKRDVGDVLENIIKIVLTQDTKTDERFNEKYVAEHVEKNSSFVKENLDEILKHDLMIGDTVRLGGKEVQDGHYEVSLFTNTSKRVLEPKTGGTPTFKEWFLNAAKNYGNKN